MKHKNVKNYYLLTAQIMGVCHDCGSRTYGKFDFQDVDTKEHFTMTCLDCGWRTKVELDSRMVTVHLRGEIEPVAT